MKKHLCQKSNDACTAQKCKVFVLLFIQIQSVFCSLPSFHTSFCLQSFSENNPEQNGHVGGTKRKFDDDDDSYYIASYVGKSSHWHKKILQRCELQGCCSHLLHVKEQTTWEKDQVDEKGMYDLQDTLPSTPSMYPTDTFDKNSINQMPLMHNQSAMSPTYVSKLDMQADSNPNYNLSDHNNHVERRDESKVVNHTYILQQFNNPTDVIEEESLEFNSRELQKIDFTNRRAIFTPEYYECARQQQKLRLLKQIVINVSSMNARGCALIISARFEAEFSANGLQTKNCIFNTAIDANTMIKAKKLDQNPDSIGLCERVKRIHADSILLIKNENSFEDNHQVFLGFVLETILQVDDKNGYELKTDLWKIQILMFELRPYLLFRLTMDREPEYDKKLNLKYSFVEEMGYIKDLLINFYKGCPNATKNDDFLSLGLVVLKYRFLILNLLQAKQYRQSPKYYVYKYGYYYKLTGSYKNVLFATRDMLLMIAFAPQPESYSCFHRKITYIESKNKESETKKIGKSKGRSAEINSKDFISTILCPNNTQIYELHLVCISLVNELKDVRGTCSNNKEVVVAYFLLFKETWLFFQFKDDEVPILKLTRGEMFVYFHKLICDEFMYEKDRQISIFDLEMEST